MELLTKEHDIVVPGEVLAIGMDYVPGEGTYRIGEKIIANRVGLVNISGRVIKLIKLSGKYIPKEGDVIICKVIDITPNGWRLDTNSPYQAMLLIKDATTQYIKRGSLNEYFEISDYIVCKVINVTSQKLVDVTMKGPKLRKLKGGRIIKVNPNKVPRVIGKLGSMVSLIKQATGCKIIVGQNGLIWIDGKPKDVMIAEKAIKKIEREAHLSGLTESIKTFLKRR